MLKKLIKHEFRATSRIMWPIFVGMLLLSALTRVSFALLERDTHWLLELVSVLILICFVFAMIVLMFTPLVLSSVRWRDHVLRDEGYLTLTLPVSLHQLLASKLIVSAVWSAAAFLVAVAALFFSAGNDLIAMLRAIPDLLGLLFEGFAMADGTLRGHLLLIGFELLGNFIFIISAASLMIFAAYSIGFAAKSHKTLFTALLVIAFVIAAQVVAMWMIGTFSSSAVPQLWPVLTAEALLQAEELFLVWGMLGEALFAAAGYGLTFYFTTKKLNLA